MDKNGFENRIKVFIWGTGKYGRKVFQVINDENCKVEGFIDNDPAKHGKTYEGIEILPFRKVEDDYDIIIISIVNYDEILYHLTVESLYH